MAPVRNSSEVAHRTVFCLRHVLLLLHLCTLCARQLVFCTGLLVSFHCGDPGYSPAGTGCQFFEVMVVWQLSLQLLHIGAVLL